MRDELRRYGRENTAQKFNQMQTHRRDMILKQRDRGVGGFMSGVSKLNKENKSMVSQDFKTVSSYSNDK